MLAKSIAKYCQQVINCFFVNKSENLYIISISKLAKSIHFRFETKDNIIIIYKLDQTKNNV